MLIAIEQLPGTTDEERAVILGYCIHNIIAVDPQTDAHLKETRGRSKAGRQHKYFVTVPNGRFYTTWEYRFVTPENPKGEGQAESYSVIFTLRAWDDAEAIEKANKLFPKKYEQFKKSLVGEGEGAKS